VTPAVPALASVSAKDAAKEAKVLRVLDSIQTYVKEYNKLLKQARDTNSMEERKERATAKNKLTANLNKLIREEKLVSEYRIKARMAQIEEQIKKKITITGGSRRRRRPSKTSSTSRFRTTRKVR
jgi:hypothetical protein